MDTTKTIQHPAENTLYTYCPVWSGGTIAYFEIYNRQSCKPVEGHKYLREVEAAAVCAALTNGRPITDMDEMILYPDFRQHYVARHTEGLRVRVGDLCGYCNQPMDPFELAEGYTWHATCDPFLQEDN